MPLPIAASQALRPLADQTCGAIRQSPFCAAESSGSGDEPMAQTTNRFFDEMARLMNDAAGVASGVRREFDTVLRSQAERILRELDVVQREEFEAVKEMARLAREENEALKARIEALETRNGSAAGSIGNEPTIL